MQLPSSPAITAAALLLLPRAPFHFHLTYSAIHHHFVALAFVLVVLHEPGRRNDHDETAALRRRCLQEADDEGEALRLPRRNQHLQPRRAIAEAVSLAYRDGKLYAHRGDALDVRVSLLHAAACPHSDTDVDVGRYSCRD
ncbi:hypothetical protein PG993_011085 [Apiospora rasikravindrae]|uniref:Uncharacterized protein n=1 Tax=Apiospora rasikravindrae TaxID=990691 RepID=A0ABR1SD77_9PEZI